jgi:tetratricopeptide (TPR) repeat protein
VALKRLIGDFLRRSHDKGEPANAEQADQLYESALECRARGDVSGARAMCEQALALSSAHAGSHHLLGVIHAQSGDLQRSLHHLEQAVAHAPGWPDAYLGYGNARQLTGDLRGAEESYRTVIELAPDAAAGHYNLGVLLRQSGRRDEALPRFARAHELDPAGGEIVWDLVQLLLDFNQLGRARTVAEETLARNAASAPAHKALGLACLHLHEPQLALEHFERSRALAPGDPESFLHQGIAAQELGRLDDALAAYEQAIRVKPDYAPAQWRRSLIRLSKGEFESGWIDYDVRRLSEGRPTRQFLQPRWQGEPLEGKTLLVYGEQGLGDEIMFASCLPEVIARAQRCVIDCHPKLAPLFERSFPGAAVHPGLQTDDPSWLQNHPAPDYQIAIGSLPAVLRNRPEAFPRHTGYLQADPRKAAAWKERLAALGPGLKLGLSWQGGTPGSRSRLRSLTLEQLLPVLQVQGVHFIDLQYTDTARERAVFERDRGMRVVHWPEAIANYDETAALITALDLTLSVCTAVVHLTGALGRPAWVMTPYSPEWRYGHAGERMVWYPSVKLVRQPRYREWEPVIDTIARELAREAARNANEAPRR